MTSTTATTPPRTDFADRKETYAAALGSFFSGKPEDTEADLSKLLRPTFTLQVDGERFDFAGFVKHIRTLREKWPSDGSPVGIRQFLRDGNQVADRHGGRSRMPDGKLIDYQTFMFGEIAEDGRIAWLEETVQRNEVKEE